MQISLFPGLTEHSWILTSVSSSTLVQYVILVDVYEKNSVSHRYTVGIQGSILIAFSGNFGIFFWFYEGRWQFLKSYMQCGIWKHYQWTFFKCYYITLKCIGWFCTLNFFTNAWFWDIRHCSSWKYLFTELSRYFKCWCILLYNTTKSFC